MKTLPLINGDSIRELAKRVNLSPPSVAERIKKLEDCGIIEGYTIKINEKALGMDIQCIIQIDIRNGEFEKFIDAIALLNAVTTTNIIFWEVPLNKAMF